MAGQRADFGYNPPTGDRGLERVDPRTFARDLQHVLDIACQHFSSIWLADHHMTEDKFRLECWTQLTWIAARFPGPLLGTIVMANSYRHPPFLAKMAASLQFFSHGRFVLGYGSGWQEPEYRAYGYDFPPTRVRIAQMVEGIEVIRALWTQSPATYAGQYYRVTDAYCEPRPAPPPPVMFGGDGERYLLRAVAEHADWWNCVPRPTPVLRHKLDVLREHCAAAGRDYEGIRKTLMLRIFLGRTKAEAERLAGGREFGDQPPFIGEPAALRDYLAELVDLGFDLFQLAFPAFPETGDMRLFVDEVMPAFR
jgi:alkanesulfonate monooxygenase SsuD/methylene tetrahydromethanopterin reductase-like flavin-dependent oxidoreductase (luciferase family)